MTEPADFPIIFDRPENGLAVVTLNRPHRRNGIVPSMMTALYAALREAAEDRGIRVLVITGAGQDFCPGADIGHYADGETRPAEGFRDTREFDVATLLHEAPAVTIAAIRGACAGAGFGWACACDFRIADDTAKFNTAFLGVGVAGDMGVPWTLPRLVGAAKARELSFLPHKFDAAEAERIGLVNRMVPAAEFEKTVEGVTAPCSRPPRSPSPH